MTDQPSLIGLEDRISYLLVVFPAYRDREHLRQCIQAGFEAAISHPSRRVLVDHTATQSRVPVPDIYDLGEALMSLRGVSTLRIALVSSRESTYPDRFFETVVKNRGMGLQVFIDDFETAASWLQS